MSKISVNASMTVRRRVEGWEFTCPDDFAPSAIAQYIQENLIGSDEEAIEFHSVEWKRND